MIEVKNLQVSFKKKTVLNNVSFELENGKVYGFLGNNGAGKTTTIKAIFNELNYNMGTITYNEIPQKNIDYSKWYFFAENNELPLTLKVSEYFQIMVSLAHLNYKEAKKVFNENEQKFHVNFKWSKKIKTLSAGERKILSTLMIMVLNPEVIFFDEPTANLDLKNKEIILNIIKLMSDSNRIIVITTHLIDEVKDLLTDIIILDQGQINYAKPYKKSDDLRAIFNANTTTNEINYEGMINQNHGQELKTQSEQISLSSVLLNRNLKPFSHEPSLEEIKLSLQKNNPTLNLSEVEINLADESGMLVISPRSGGIYQGNLIVINYQVQTKNPK